MEPLPFSVSFMTCLPPGRVFMLRLFPAFLFHAVSLAHFSPSGLPYSTATMAFPFKSTVYLMKPLPFSVSS